MRTVQVVKALFDYTAQTEEELSFKEGDILHILQDELESSKDHQDWWLARKNGEITGEQLIGWIPSNYVTEVSLTFSISRKKVDPIPFAIPSLTEGDCCRISSNLSL
jgi:hypothetical protein